MKRLLLIALPLLLCLPLRAQDTLRVAPVADSVADAGAGEWEPPAATPQVLETQALSRVTAQVSPVHDTVYVLRTDTLRLYHTDTLHIYHTDTVVRREADTAALKALQEKEVFYREILSANGVDKEKLEAERNYYIHMVDSLRTIVRIAELENVRKEEANKYLEERAKAAEERVAQATNRKKKVRPIQGVAMRFYRTPAWEIRLNASSERYIANRNAGSIEFDYVTGASVMLWDLTKYFNHTHHLGSDSTSRSIRRFDQDFAYDLGVYVGFGGSNLFKNFYVGASFRFVDFFYLTVGMNIAEYQVLADGYESGEVLLAGQSIDDITAKAWLLKPFVSLSIDLDFLSYIKK
jgi:hypothetical protein